MLDYTLRINNVDFTSVVERDSYSTSQIPVYSESVLTMDGVTHVALLRNKCEIQFEFNPQNASDTKTMCEALLTMPCSVYFFSLQEQVYRYVNMTIDQHTASYLSRCLYRGERWNKLERITLTEL